MIFILTSMWYVKCLACQAVVQYSSYQVEMQMQYNKLTSQKFIFFCT